MKNPILLVLLAVLLCFMFACQNKAEKAELEKFRMQAKVEEQNRALAKRVMEAVSTGDIETIKEFVAPAFVRYSPSTTMDIRSLEEFVEHVKMVHRGIPDINIRLEETYAEADRVICRYIMGGTHQGEFAGIPATGNNLATSGIVIFRIENGKAVEAREEFDSVGFMQQLGMELKPKETEKK